MCAQVKFYYCEFASAPGHLFAGPRASEAHVSRAPPTVRNESECRQAGGKWANHRYNFDNLGQALLSLFVMASKDGWVQIMYQGIDAVGEDREPIENYNEWRMIYFIGFLLFVACASPRHSPLVPLLLCVD